MIYLDHNATTPVADAVLNAMAPFQQQQFFNPSALSANSALVRRQLEAARGQIAEYLNCAANQLIFTGSGTAANNLAIKGALAANPQIRQLIISATEHASVREVARYYQRQGLKVLTWPVDEQGQFAAEFVNSVESVPTMVSLQWVNHETGIIYPLAELITALKQHLPEVIVHVDAIQALGKLPLDLTKVDADLVSFSAHKISAPKGVGALVKLTDVALEPLLHGGGQELGFNSGTENVAGVLAFAAAIAILAVDFAARQQRWQQLKNYLEPQLLALPDTKIVGLNTKRVANTTLVLLPYYDGPTWLKLLGAADIIVATGSACTALNWQPSIVLHNMGFELAEVERAVRISFGADTTMAEVEQLVAVIKQHCADVEARYGS